jgi:hypothetical protein
MANRDCTRKQSHSSTSYHFNPGRYDPEHKNIYNKLNGLRDAARYHNIEFTFNSDDAVGLLQKVNNIMTYTEQYIRPL